MNIVYFLRVNLVTLFTLKISKWECTFLFVADDFYVVRFHEWLACASGGKFLAGKCVI